MLTPARVIKVLLSVSIGILLLLVTFSPPPSPVSVGGNDLPIDEAAGEIIIDGDFTDWTVDDVVSLDPCATDRYGLGDGKDDGRDLVAAYSRLTDTTLYLRIDLLDLQYEAETGFLDIYVLVDFATGGQEWLPDFTECRTDSPWEIAVALYDSDHHAVYYSDWSTHNSTFLGAGFHSQYDSVEFAIATNALAENGYIHQSEIRFQFFTTKDGTNGGDGELPDADVIDAIPDDHPWEDGYLNGTVSSENPGNTGTAKVGIFHHGNQFLKNVEDFIKDTSGLGFYRVPEIHEKWNVPVNLHVSGTLAEGAQWFVPDFNRYLRELVDSGIVHMVGGFYDEYIPQYVPEQVNLWSMEYAREMIEYYYNDTEVPFCWVPERVFWDGYESLVKDGGYEAVMVDTEDGFIWYAEPQGHSNEHKLYEAANGIKILFISNRGRGGAPGNVQDQFHSDHDGGLSLGLRQDFLELARSTDQEQYALYMDDWEKTCGNIPLWGGAEAVERYENTISWLATHPWISVQPIENFLDWTPEGTVDVDDCSYFWLSGKTGSMNDPHHAGNLYDAWYSDPQGEVNHDSYYDHVPKDCVMNMGHHSAPGTIIGDTWELISGISPTSPLYELAMKTFSNGLYETAWFEGDWPDIYIPYWQKEQAAHVRCAAVYRHVDDWLGDAMKDYSVSSFDVDLDGSDEIILSNGHIYCVFEGRGGKLAYAFDSRGHQVVGNTPTGWLDDGDAVTDAVTSTTTNSHYNGDHMGVAETPGEEYLEGSKTFAFSDMGRENDIYSSQMNADAGTVTFSHDGITKIFHLNGSAVMADYSLTRGIPGGPGIRFTFSPDLASILEEGQDVILETGNKFGDHFGWENQGVAGAVTLSDDLEFMVTGSNIGSRYLELKPLTSDFTIIVHISEITDITISNRPPRVDLLSPVNGALVEDRTPALSWEGADVDGDELEFEIMMDISPSRRTVLASNITGSNFTVPQGAALKYNTTYYWTVIPYDLTGAGTCTSGIWNFTIAPEPLPDNDTPSITGRPVVIILSPENNSIMADNVTVSGEASHQDANLSIVILEMSIGGADWFDITGSLDLQHHPYAFTHTFDTRDHPNGSLTLRIRAFDGNNHSAPAVLHITVENGPGSAGDDDDNDDIPPHDDTDDDDAPGGNGGDTSSVRGKICFNVTLFFILPILAIILIAIFIEVMLERRRKRKKKVERTEAENHEDQ